MIVIDMDIPKCCGTCRMSGTDVCNEWTNLKGYDMGQKRADTCPIKCDIEDIRAKIEQSRYGLVNDGLDLALKIIDRYAKGEQE